MATKKKLTLDEHDKLVARVKGINTEIKGYNEQANQEKIKNGVNRQNLESSLRALNEEGIETPDKDDPGLGDFLSNLYQKHAEALLKDAENAEKIMNLVEEGDYDKAQELSQTIASGSAGITEEEAEADAEEEISEEDEIEAEPEGEAEDSTEEEVEEEGEEEEEIEAEPEAEEEAEVAAEDETESADEDSTEEEADGEDEEINLDEITFDDEEDLNTDDLFEKLS